VVHLAFDARATDEPVDAVLDGLLQAGIVEDRGPENAAEFPDADDRVSQQFTGFFMSSSASLLGEGVALAIDLRLSLIVARLAPVRSWSSLARRLRSSSWTETTRRESSVRRCPCSARSRCWPVSTDRRRRSSRHHKVPTTKRLTANAATSKANSFSSANASASPMLATRTHEVPATGWAKGQHRLPAGIVATQKAERATQRASASIREPAPAAGSTRGWPAGSLSTNHGVAPRGA